jgi:hypothetical protein
MHFTLHLSVFKLGLAKPPRMQMEIKLEIANHRVIKKHSTFILLLIKKSVLLSPSFSLMSMVHCIVDRPFSL